MTNIVPRPEDSFPMDATVGVTEVVIAPLGGTTGQVPTRKFKRCIYAVTVANRVGANNWIEIRTYSSATPAVLEHAWRMQLTGNQTLVIARPMKDPVLTVKAGQILKAIAEAASIDLHAMAYDLG